MDPNLLNGDAFRHGHSVISTGEAHCPYCGQPISRKEFKDIQARIEAEARAQVEEIEASLRRNFAQQQRQTEAKAESEIERIKRDLAKTTQEKIAAIRSAQEATTAAKLKAAEQRVTEAVNAEKVKAFEEKNRLTAQLNEMQRRLERKTAAELGEPAELDLFEALKREFPKDHISRVAKGVNGADIVHRVMNGSTATGTIIYDCKNRSRWMNSYASKLRADQLREGADFAVLSTNVFPAGAAHLHVQDHVIIASPGRVVVLSHILRRQVIQNNVLRIGNEDRNSKSARLFDFINSEQCRQLLDQIVGLSEAMTELDGKENRAHQLTWNRRADLIQGIQEVHQEFSTAIDRIVGGRHE